jgi:lysophospholipase L1-like esterase
VSAAPRASAVTAGQARRQQLSFRRQLLFSAIIVVGLLVAAECAVRVWALYFRTSYERYNRQTGRLELRPNIRYSNWRGEEFRINAKGFVGPEFDDVPPPSVYRIIALGDSCTFATGFWEIGYPTQLERLLNVGTGPSRRFEVINAGIEGYNSTFALARIREELLRYRPHMMIVYIGWNDLMKTDPANAARVDQYRWLATLMDESYLVKAYKKLLFITLRPLVLRPTSDDPGDAVAFDDFVPEQYRENLVEMVRVLRQHDVEVVLVTLPTVVRPRMTLDEIRQANVFFPYFAGAYGVSRLLSLLRVYNRTIVEVGREERVEVVDLAGVFDSLPDKRPHFWDTMHPNAKGGAVIAKALSGRIAELVPGGRP